MKQIILHANQTEPSSTVWTGFGGQLLVTLEGQAQTPWFAPGTFRNFVLRLTNPPGSGNSWTITIYKNGVATSVSITISDSATEGQDLSNSFAVAQDDLLTLRWVANGTPSSTGTIFYNVEFEGTTSAQSGYAQQPGVIPDSTRRTGVFWPCYQSTDTWTAVAGTDMENVVPADGTLSGYSVFLSQVAGTGKSFTFNIYKNGVKQDGTGGTVDTTLVISGSNAAGAVTFPLPLSAGDRVYTEVVTSGSPNADIRAGIAFGFVADTNGQSVMGGWDVVAPATNSTQYHRIHGFEGAWPATESATQAPGHPTDYSLSHFYARAYVAPGSGNNWAFTVRDNSTDTDLAITLSDATQQDSDLTGTVSVTDASLLNIRIVPSSLPDSGRLTWSLVQTVAADAIRATTIFGENATVTSTHTFAANMDAVTRTIHLPNTMFVAPNLTMPEVSSPPTAIANMGRIWFEDNGSGKTRLMVQFGTGAAQQIAIEP